jgi:hypothetical protein
MLIHQLGVYNLYLLRNIFEAFEEKGEKVVRNFRTDRYSVLRPKMLVIPDNMVEM